MKTLFRILGAAAAVAATGAAIVVMDKILHQKDPLHVEEVEFPEEAETDPAEAEKTAEAYAEGEAKAAGQPAAEEAAPAEENPVAEPNEDAAPAQEAVNEPVTLPDLSEERPICDADGPNPNPVEAGPAVAPKDESGKFDPTRIAEASDFGDWEEQGCKG